MTLPFRVPLTAHEISAYVSMPKTRGGHVIHPDYVPKEQQQDYLARLGAWCRRTPRSDWPQWLAEFVDRAKRERASVRADGPGLGEGDQPAGDGGLAGGEG